MRFIHSVHTWNFILSLSGISSSHILNFETMSIPSHATLSRIQRSFILVPLKIWPIRFLFNLSLVNLHPRILQVLVFGLRCHAYVFANSMRKNSKMALHLNNTGRILSSILFSGGPNNTMSTIRTTFCVVE